MSEAIELQELKKTYAAYERTSAKEALKGINLTIPHGSIYSILGPNGAGKSTTINILAGLVIKTSGLVRICGFDIDTQPRLARASIGIVPQEVNVDFFFTVREILDMQAGFFGIPAKKRRTDDILKALGLYDKRHSNIQTLSGGMKRRVLIAKALVHSPPVLVLDEPTAGVDVELRKGLWAYVRELNAQGVTIILTTHYLEEAEELSDYIAIVHEGQLLLSQEKKELLRRFAQKSVILTLSQPLWEIPPALERFDTKVGPMGECVVRLERSTQQSILGEILDSIKQLGLSIVDISTREVGLEEIFTQLIRK